MSAPRRPDPRDVPDEEPAVVAPSLTLRSLAAPQRRHALREVFDARRGSVHAAPPWRSLPDDLPPWPVVSEQTQRWPATGCLAAVVDDLRALSSGHRALPRRGGAVPAPGQGHRTAAGGGRGPAVRRLRRPDASSRDGPPQRTSPTRFRSARTTASSRSRPANGTSGSGRRAGRLPPTTWTGGSVGDGGSSGRLVLMVPRTPCASGGFSPLASGWAVGQSAAWGTFRPGMGSAR